MGLFRRFKSNKKTGSGSASDTYVIVGLGNPGAEYAKTRHNMGYRALDALDRAESQDARSYWSNPRLT